jgi:multiple sugar transport system substrate-binding protein
VRRPAAGRACPGQADRGPQADGRARQADRGRQAAAGALAEPKVPTFSKAPINGRLTIVQSRDFHPDHNALIERKMKEFAEQMGYALDHSYIEAYAGSGNVVNKLTAAVQAGDAPDMLIHTLRPAELQFLEVIDPVDDLAGEINRQYGEPLPALKRRAFLDGKYWAIPHFTRAGGYFARTGPFKEAGIDIVKDVDTMEKLRDACLKASKPDKELYGWGITVNRSGDGETVVREAVMFAGGQLTDETGQVVVLNKEPFREHAIRGLTFLKETYQDPKWAPMLPPGVGAWTDTSNNEAYLANRIIYTSNAGTMFAKALVDKNPVADDTYLVPKPKGVGPQGRSLNGADSMNFFIMKGAKNRDAAAQMIQYLMSPDVYREMFRISTGYVYPAHQWGWNEPVLNEGKLAEQVTNAWKVVAFDPSGYTAGEWPGPPSPHVASLESSNFWTDMMGEILNGTPVEQAVKNGHDKAVRVFKEFGAKGE